jgi:hypothetical protein
LLEEGNSHYNSHNVKVNLGPKTTQCRGLLKVKLHTLLTSPPDDVNVKLLTSPPDDVNVKLHIPTALLRKEESPVLSG